MTERTIKLVLEYDGTCFAGWQVQPGFRTVQSELEGALSTLCREKVSTVAAGRTDAGVHALGQVAGFRTRSDHPCRVFVKGLNALLPEDVVVKSATEVGPDFHARRSARGKWYRYLVRDGGVRSALSKDRAWEVPWKLEVSFMLDASRGFIGTHDFSSFRSSSCEAKSPVREMRRIEIWRDSEGIVVFQLWAQAFLKQMARAIVGTLVEVGRGKMESSRVEEILEERDRTVAGPTAPARGLYLLKVDYWEET
ncbi:MAG: tRNA pseudouridine(38-40) synthase TruA [bacterium]